MARGIERVAMKLPHERLADLEKQVADQKRVIQRLIEVLWRIDPYLAEIPPPVLHEIPE